MDAIETLCAKNRIHVLGFKLLEFMYVCYMRQLTITSSMQHVATEPLPAHII